LKTARHLIASLRPKQWTKNGFVLIPLLFAQKVFDGTGLLQAFQAAAAFCLVTGAVYLINDLFDMESDRRHPTKSRRPLAAGLIGPRTAWVTAGALLLAAVIWGWIIGKGFFVVMAIYLLIQLMYNAGLKQVVIVDIFCVSSGFFLRVIGGALAIQVSISHWLIICTTLISMFLSLAKRRHELMTLGNNGAVLHRAVLGQYNLQLLDQMIAMITASTLLSYMLYCISPETIARFKSDHLIYTFPFVLYGILRYLFLIYRRNEGDSPEKLLLSDTPLFLSIACWGMVCLLVIYGVV
jgi:4-hydroxybenzoate polyprenyltransferase